MRPPQADPTRAVRSGRATEAPDAGSTPAVARRLEGLARPGVYVLLLRLARADAFDNGALGRQRYPAGWYVYVGSAMGGLGSRLRHHLGPHRRPRWHIDRLLLRGRLAAAIVAATPERLECRVAGLLASRLRTVPRFGSSDCRCRGHLFWGRTRAAATRASMDAFKALGCRPWNLGVGALLLGLGVAGGARRAERPRLQAAESAVRRPLCPAGLAAGLASPDG